ncbi:hypothetical protein [Nocardioides sp.]
MSHGRIRIEQYAAVLTYTGLGATRSPVAPGDIDLSPLVVIGGEVP